VSQYSDLSALLASGHSIVTAPAQRLKSISGFNSWYICHRVLRRECLTEAIHPLQNNLKKRGEYHTENGIEELA
jgi:hypothetical protein